MTKKRRPFTKSDHRMIHLAKDRGQVKLDTGQTVTLIAWRPDRYPDGMRVRFFNGTTALLPVTQVASVVEVLTDA